MDECRACDALRTEHGSYAEMYSRRLLEPGWAGTLSLVEQTYVAAHARNRAVVRAILRGAALVDGPQSQTPPGASNRLRRRAVQDGLRLRPKKGRFVTKRHLTSTTIRSEGWEVV